jgi:hypothetical protein
MLRSEYKRDLIENKCLLCLCDCVRERCSVRCPSAFNSFELPSWMLYQDVQLLQDSGLVGVKAATRCRVQVQYWRGT